MLKLQDMQIPGLKTVSLTIEAGECVGISGDSGCGKTRMLRAIADMDACEGEVCIGDTCRQDVSAHEWRKKVCLLPADSQWWFDTVGPHFPESGVDWSSLGFEPDVMQWQIARCSSGEKQRLGILRMLVNHPRVLLLDEPTANLDAENTQKVEDLIDNYLQENNSMAIWVSHNHAQLRRVSPHKSFDLSDGELARVEESKS